MKRKDLRKNIITNADGDSLYLDSYEEQYKSYETYEVRRTSATDFAQTNNAYVSDQFKTRRGKPTTWCWLDSALDNYVDTIDHDGSLNIVPIFRVDGGIRPRLHYYRLISRTSRGVLSNPEKDTIKEIEEFDIREIRDTEGNVIYHTLQLGEYPKTKVNDDLNEKLESLYHGGKIKDELTCTGRWYSCNGGKEECKNYAGKHFPEFEYRGERYVRTTSNVSIRTNRHPAEALPRKSGTVRWMKVEPISFIIKNWEQMPKSINPEGNGRTKYFDLIAEEAITSNIPFYPWEDLENEINWDTSTIRGFLNGINVSLIYSKANDTFIQGHGGNFEGECNFLNEAFNLSREPIVEYTIPSTEKEIPDDAFNGCLTLKKLVIHSGINNSGKRAFDGLSFKYAYRTNRGDLVLSQELPENANEYTNAISLVELEKNIMGFDYGILLQKEKTDELVKSMENFSKVKLMLPFEYVLELVRNGKENEFCTESDFRFFKNEIPEINDMLLEFPEGERYAFFKFAKALGCFSTEKILYKNGIETQTFLAQKASSVLAQLLRTEGMKLRQISKPI